MGPPLPDGELLDRRRRDRRGRRAGRRRAPSYTKDVGSGAWEGASTFDPGSGELEITCDASGGEIQIGPAPEIGGFVGGLVGGILLALFLGAAGFVLLIVIGVLYATGRPRNVPAPQ